MKKFICLIAFSLAMLTASASDFTMPTPQTDIGIQVSQQMDNYMTDVQATEFIWGGNAQFLLIDLMPVFMEQSIEYIHTDFPTGDSPLYETTLYSSSEPPNYSYSNMNGQDITSHY